MRWDGCASSVTTPSPMSEIASSGPLLNKHETFPPVRPAHNLPSLRLILRGVRQRPFVLEHLAEIAAIDPAIAGRAADEMVGLVCRRVAETLSDVFAAREIDQGEPVKREGYSSAGVFPVAGFTRWTRAQAGHRIET